MSRYLGIDPSSASLEAFHYDEDTQRFAVETRQDVEPILDANKRAQADGDGYTPSREMRHIARIPNVVIEKWINELGVNVFNKDHAPAVRRLLNDPDWRFLRTSPGRF